MRIYSIKNEKIGFFNRPIYVESAEEALSYIQNILMSDADRALLGLKDDLALYFLGEIDFTTGNIIPLDEEFRRVCDLSEIFESIPKDRIPNFNLVDQVAADNATIRDLLDDVSKRLDRVMSCSVIRKAMRNLPNHEN